MEVEGEQKSFRSSLSALVSSNTQPPTFNLSAGAYLWPDSCKDPKEQQVIVIAVDSSSDGDRPPEEEENEGEGDGEGQGLAVDDRERNSNSPGYINNPLVQLIREHELGKILLSFVVPFTTGVLTVYARDPHSLPDFPVISLSLCLGLSAVWNGILLRDQLPRAANVIQQLGTASIFFAFFYVLSSLLPPNMVWLIWTCFLVVLLPSLFSCVPM